MFMCLLPCLCLKLCLDAMPSAFIALLLLFMPFSCALAFG